MTDPSKLPQDRSEHDQRELARQRERVHNGNILAKLLKRPDLVQDTAHERLKRYRDSRSDAPVPVCQYERD